jgi:hypothetical protein
MKTIILPHQRYTKSSYMNRVILPTLAIFFSVFSCKNEYNNLGENIIKPVSVIDVNSFTDSVSYVKLQMTSDCIISEVSKIIFIDSTYIVTDNSRSNNSLYIFDHTGRFINKINRSGRGPGEYINISNIDFCERNRNIYVYDLSNGNILEYSLTGDHIETISTGGFVAYDFKVITPDLFALYSPDVTNYINETKVPKGLHLFDRNKGYKGSIQNLPEDTEIISAFDSGWLTEYDERISLVSAINGEIYSVNESEVVLTWRFRFPEVLFRDILPIDKPIYKAYPAESERFIFYYLLFEKSSQVYPVLFDKKTQSGVVSDSLINEHYRRTTIFWGGTKETFFSAAYPSVLNDQERSAISMRLGTEINSQDNPLIAIYHLKRFED